MLTFGMGLYPSTASCAPARGWLAHGLSRRYEGPGPA